MAQLFLRAQWFDWYAKPVRGFLALSEYADFDRRTLSQYGMQPAVMSSCSIRRENR